MATKRLLIVIAIVALLLVVGCATTPEAESRRATMMADIDEILSLSEASGLGEPVRCLSEHAYRGFRPLGDQYLLFEGRRNKQWVNKLRIRCPDIRHGQVIMIEPFINARVCDADRFQVSDWFHWPWYGRWRPWHWGPGWGTGIYCSLGKFYPVTEGQVAEIEALLK
ncbi:MAG: DUF6491 family protein [Woeseiaceae bacterium]|nr:DUF6491 family protein [Woeseiaceae bacterium]